MQHNIKQRDWEIWLRFEQSHIEFNRASSAFLSDDIDRVAILKQALHGPGHNTAVYILRWVPVVDLQGLLPELLDAALKLNGWENAARDAIMRIPKGWLLENIENAADPYLKNGQDEEYQLLLELYADIDFKLAQKLALKALEHDNLGIRETGRNFLMTGRWVNENI